MGRRLKDLELLGRLSAAAAMAEIAFDRARAGDEFQMMVAGAWRRLRLFAEAEQRQKKREPESPLPYSFAGTVRDRFLSQAFAEAAGGRCNHRRRAPTTALPVVLDTMTIGRAHLAMALSRVETTFSSEKAGHGRSALQLEERRRLARSWRK
jgi:hypothetical protein